LGDSYGKRDEISKNWRKQKIGSTMGYEGGRESRKR